MKLLPYPGDFSFATSPVNGMSGSAKWDFVRGSAALCVYLTQE